MGSAVHQVGIGGKGQRFVGKREFADHGVTEALGAVGTLVHAVACPPGVELGHLDGQLPDQLVQLGVVGVAAGRQAQAGDERLGDFVPVPVQIAGGGVEQDEAGEVALAVRQRVEVG